MCRRELRRLHLCKPPHPSSGADLFCYLVHVAVIDTKRNS